MPKHQARYWYFFEKSASVSYMQSLKEAIVLDDITVQVYAAASLQCLRVLLCFV